MRNKRIDVEMKAPGGRLRPEQGYEAVCCYCWQDAAAVIERYLGGDV